jgi:hypothetical protein
MTRYSELYRKEREEMERLKADFERQLRAILGDLNLLRDFVRENDLQGRLAEWATKRTTLTSGQGK